MVNLLDFNVQLKIIKKICITAYLKFLQSLRKVKLKKILIILNINFLIIIF